MNTTASHKKTSICGALLLVLTAAIWGTGIVSGKVGVSRLDPFAFTMLRNLFAGLFLWAVALILDKRNSRKKAAGHTGKENGQSFCSPLVLRGGILCGIFLFMGTILQHTGLQYVEAGKGGFLMALYMVIVPFVSLLFMRQKIQKSLYLCIPLALVALWLLSVNEAMTLGKGEVLSFLSAIGYAGHILMADRYVKRVNIIKMSTIQFLFGAALACVDMFLAGGAGTLRYLPEVFWPMLYCGVVAGGIGFTLQLVGQQYVAPSFVGLLLSLEAVFSVLIGFIVLHERLTGREIIGCVLMFAAIIISQLPTARSQNET